MADDDPQLLLLTLGFMLFPVDKDAMGSETCAMLAVPRAPLVPHRAMFIIPHACADGAPDESLDPIDEGTKWRINVGGLIASFSRSVNQPATVLRSPDPPIGHSPACGEDDIDFSRVPDFETMCTGLRLRRGFESSRSEHVDFRFRLEGGEIGGLIDENVCDRVWRWSLSEKDERHRVTGTTLHKSAPLRSLVIEFRPRGSNDPRGRVRLKPIVFGGRSYVIVLVVNLPIDYNGNPIDGEQHAVNLSHAHAMTQICEVDPHTSIRMVFGEQLSESEAALKANQQQIRTMVPWNLGIEILEEFKARFKGDPSCSGRRMPTRP